MYKSDLIDAIANRTLKKDADIKIILDAATEIIRERLIAGESVTLQGFGTFEVRTQAARVARNPKTGEPVEVGEKQVPAFRAGRALKDALN